MPFVTEDGTGLPDATSFITLAFFKQYADDRGRDYSAHNDTAIEQAIARGTFYLSESFRWKGVRKRLRNNAAGYQALAWPRYGVYDRQSSYYDYVDGYYTPNYGYGLYGSYVDDDVIPREVQWATCEAALYELDNPNALQPAYTPHDRVKMERAGPVAVTYDTSRQDAWGARPVLLVIMDLIGQFLSDRGGNRLSGQAVRG